MALTHIEDTPTDAKGSGRGRLAAVQDRVEQAKAKGSRLVDQIPGGPLVASFILGEPVDGGAQTVRFRRPKTTARRVHTMRLLLVAAAALAVLSAASSIPMVNDLYDNAQANKESMDPAFREALDDFYAAEQGDDEEAELEAAEWVVFVTKWRDGATVLENLSLLLLIVLAAVVVWIPIKYLLLLRAMPSGHPRIWWQLQGLAKLQITVELVKVFVLLWATSGTFLVKANVGFAPAFVIAPIILWMLRGHDVKAFFSHHGFAAEQGPEPPAPAAPDAPPA